MADDKLKLEDLLVGIGIKSEEEAGFKTIEEFNGEFNKVFIKRSAVPDDKEIVDPIIGRRIAPEENDLKRHFKELGVVFEASDLKDEEGKPKKLSEIRQVGFEKLEALHKAKVKELEDNADGNIDERITELTKERDKFKKKSEQLKESSETLQGTVESQKKDFKTKIEDNMIKTELNTIKSGLTFKEGITDLERKGLDSLLTDGFSFEVEEEGEGDDAVQKVIVRDKEGNFIKNEKKAGEFLSPKDVIEQEAASNKLLKVNGTPSDKRTKFTPPDDSTKTDRDDIITAKIHPNATKAAEDEAAAVV